MTQRTVTQTAWATWTFYSTPIPLSVSWPASPAKRDRMHLTHLSASSQVVIRACQPQAARAFTKQVLQVHSSQFCCVFLPPCQSLPNLGNLYCLLQLLHQNFLLFTFQILEHSWFFLRSLACSSPVLSFHSTGSWFSWFGEENSVVAIGRLHPLKVSS